MKDEDEIVKTPLGIPNMTQYIIDGIRTQIRLTSELKIAIFVRNQIKMQKIESGMLRKIVNMIKFTL